MEELSSRIAQLSPAKRALLELRLKQGSTREAQSIPPRTNHTSAEVSFAQQRLWFLDQIEENRALYNVPRAMRLSGALDIPALQRTLNELVSRHEPFRTYFASVDGTLRQIISEKAELPLTRIDLSEDRADRATEIIREESLRPFDLAHGPIIRATLLRLGEHEHILLLCTHHIVSDAWSAGILFRELEALYNAFSTGKPSPLAPLPIQYADYAEWQRNWLQGEVLESQLSYWKNQLQDVTGILDLPTDRPRAAGQLSRGAYKVHTLSHDLSSRLAELSKREGATLFMTLLAAFQTLLWRYSNQDDIVVGSPIAGRNRVEIEDLIGFFINTLVLRANLSGNPTFKALLDQVKGTAVGAYAHQDLPFEKLVEELQPQRDLNRNPLFQVMFQFQNTAPPQPNLNGLSTTRVKLPTETAKFDLLLLVREQDDALLCVLEYNSDLFEGETIERMLSNYATLLESIVTNPDAHIADLPLLTTAQRKQILIEWNATDAEFPYQKSIHQLFQEQAQLTPNDIALVCDNTRLTFAELNARANQLAQYLRKRGVGPEVRVAICLERSVEMIVGLLAILKAGGTYAPLEPTFPAERIAFIQADSQARVLLTQQHLSRSWTGETIYLDSDWPEIARESPEAPTQIGSAENSAHVIYTSGSTGRPKGVVSSHRASINRFAWMWRAYPFVPGEVCCQKTSLSFVDSIWEIFGPLLQGVPLVIIPDDVVKDPQRFITALATNNVTRLVLVPSLLRVMLELNEDLAQQLGNLRICVCSGETLPVELATSFRQKLPQTLLINLYGSSEVAADVLCYEVDRTEGLATIPLGRPIANTSVYVLDSNFQPVPVDVPGEICVGGEGLARGYLNRPELTAEKFVPDPFSAESDARLFRTGDIGRYLPDGNIEYRGRRDHQVKLRGFRIELGEIEAQLATHPLVNQAVAIASESERGEKQIVAYVVADGDVSTDELRDHLSRKLPGYMIPAAFVFLDAFPLTASGKINRLALPRPGPVERKEFVAPRTAAEEILAGIWTDVLKVPEIGVNDDFFRLGGHSLLLARIASRIREAFNVDLSLRVLFEASTVAELAKRVETTTLSEDSPLIRIEDEREPTLSFAQDRLWFFDQLEPDSGAYNIPRMLRLRGPLDVAALQKSVNEIVLRHEVLRTSFINDNGKPALSIAENAAVEIQLIDLSGRDEELQELASDEAQRPFDLSRGPLLRLTLLQLGHDDHVLLVTTHHIISDAWSIGIFMRELVACYNAFSNGDHAALAPLNLQYSDFASWQREWLSGPRLQTQLDYWRQTLAGAPPVIDLPTDRPRPASRSFRGARHSFVIGKETIDKLKTVARSANATLFMVLLTAFQSLLSCLTNANDLVVGSPTAGRNQSETEALIGYFANTIILRAQFPGDPAFRESLSRTRETAIAAFANQDLPFEKLVDELKPVRMPSYNPLFQVWFVLQNVQIEREEFRDVSMESIAIDNATTRHDLQLTLWESANGLEGAFTYSTDLFEADTIKGIAEQFKTLVGLVSEQPDIELSALRTAMNEKLSAATEERSRQKLKSARRKVVNINSA